jgi:DNA-binding beta-propeller fold protein YncE
VPFARRASVCIVLVAVASAVGLAAPVAAQCPGNGCSYSSVSLIVPAVRPSGLAVDGAGRLYATTPERNQWHVLNPDGTLVRSVTVRGNTPIGIAVSAGPTAVAVADNAGNQVEVYDAQGAFQSSVGAGGVLHAPLGVAFDSSGNIYVANTQDAEVAQFGPSGNLLDRFEAQSHGPPQWVATSREGLVYGIAQSPAVSITPGLYVLGVGLVSTAIGPAPVEIGPTAIAVDSVGDAYVGDATTNSVLQFDSSGRLLTSFGASGSAPGQFTSPALGGVAIDSADNLYVVDNTGGPDTPGRIQKFALAPAASAQLTAGPRLIGRSAVTARLRCRARGAARCTGMLQVRRRRSTIGERPFSIAAGAVGSVRVALPAWARRVLRLGRKLDVDLQAYTQPPVGRRPHLDRLAVVLRRPR